MDEVMLDQLEKRFAVEDPPVFYAIRELRLRARIAERAFGELYAEHYNSPPMVFGNVKMER